MILYIPAPSAQPLSDALWALTRPHGLRGADDTRYLFPWTAAVDGSVWLMVDTDFSIPVHAEAELNGIAEVLQPYIERGDLPAGANAELAALVESKRGQRLVVYEAFPQFFKEQAKTHAQMVGENKLPKITP